MADQQHLATLSAAREVGSFAWRHDLAWRQLSLLWNISIVKIADMSGPNLENIAALSVALENENDGSWLNNPHMADLAKILFLDRLKVVSNSQGQRTFECCESYSNDEEFSHVFRINGDYALTQGLPHSLTIYGTSPRVTPLEINDSLEILLTLNDIPVIAAQSRDLLVGVDPWQLGAPSCPMLYKILSNWLSQRAGLQHSMIKPYAAIRLDDLPTTAEQAKHQPPNANLDKRRSRVLRKLRKFGERENIKFTLMYSSHLNDDDSAHSTVSSIMVRSIEEMRDGARRGVFEIGSHGMIHLRGNAAGNSPMDPREFLDLDEQQTRLHLSKCDAEIQRLFLTEPSSFVAPAWGYRVGVTKKVAAERYSVIVDSSQHMEDGSCDILMGRATEGEYINATETFRVSERVLTYGDWRFWQCYAVAGIPVHYMQHTDSNWHVCRNLFGRAAREKGGNANRVFRAALVIVDDASQSKVTRVVSAALLTCYSILSRPSLRRVLWKAITASSVYHFLRAMRLAGYEFVTLGELRARVIVDARSNLSSECFGGSKKDSVVS